MVMQLVCRMVPMLVGVTLAAAATLELPNGAAIAGAFTPEQPAAWTVSEAGWQGPGDGTWHYALAGNATASDYSLTATVTLLNAATSKDGMETGRFAVFNNLAELGGYEAGVLVRYRSRDEYYRVAMSSLWGEVVVWKPTGGIVQAIPYPFEIGPNYTLRVNCVGDRISLAVNGEELATWVDRCEPILQGRVGLACREGGAAFGAVTLDSAVPLPEPPPMPAFNERQWHNMRWFFDGNEPVCTLLTNNVYDLMKFRPGYRPLLYTYNYITDWSRFSPTKVTAYRLSESGDRLVVETTAEDPKSGTAVAQQARMVITYEPATNTYRYDHTCITHLPESETTKVAPEWDHGDAVFLGGVGSSVTRDPNAAKPRYLWSVFGATDGNVYKVPFNHNMFYRGKETTNGGPLQPGGIGLVPVGDPVLSPVVAVPELSPEIDRVHVGHCWWAYDMHTMFVPKQVDKAIPAGDYTTRVVYSGMEAATATALLAKAAFYKPANLDLEVPVYTAGIGFTESFDRVVKVATPHTEHRIFAGTIDLREGHAAPGSLRLSGPTEAWTLTGGSYFTGAYPKRVRVSGWVKTRDVQGDGPAIGFHRMDTDAFEYHPTGLTGTRDWTAFSYVTDFPANGWGVHLYWRNAGTGTAWFDDFRIDPVADDTPLSVRPYPQAAVDPDIVLKWTGEGADDGVLDRSGYGAHGKFYGVTRAEVDGRRVMVLDGKTSYIWPLATPQVTLGPETTMVFDLKPEGGGYLIMWGFAFQYSLTGGPKFGLYYWSAGKGVYSKPLLEANVWQRLAIVVTEGRIAYYVNGEPVEEVEAATLPGKPANHTGSTWHRHLSFFGAGSADYDPEAIATAPSSCIKGQVSAVTVYRRALTAAEVAQLGTDGLPAEPPAAP